MNGISAGLAYAFVAVTVVGVLVTLDAAGMLWFAPTIFAILLVAGGLAYYRVFVGSFPSWMRPVQRRFAALTLAPLAASAVTAVILADSRILFGSVLLVAIATILIYVGANVAAVVALIRRLAR